MSDTCLVDEVMMNKKAHCQLQELVSIFSCQVPYILYVYVFIRVLYLPSLGLCLLVAVGARRVYHLIHHKVSDLNLVNATT